MQLMNKVKRETSAAKRTEYVLATSLVLRHSTTLPPAQRASARRGQRARVAGADV